MWSVDGISGEQADSLAAGEYMVTVADQNNCTAVVSFSIGEPDAIVVTVDSLSDVLCSGDNSGSATLSIAGGTPPYDINWGIDGVFGQTAENLPAGSYDVVVTDDEGCTGEVSFVINETASIEITIETIVNVDCRGESTGSINFSVVGGTVADGTYQLLLNGEAVDAVINLAAGNYTLTVIDDNNCSAEATFEITEPVDGLSVTIESDAALQCSGEASGSLMAVVEGGVMPYVYQWSPTGDTTATIDTIIQAGLYEVLVTDANGCTASASVTIDTLQDALELVVESLINVDCKGEATGSIALTIGGGIEPYDIEWDNGDTTATIDSLVAGTYSVTVTDQNGCTADSSL